MRQLFSTDGIAGHRTFHSWMDMLSSRSCIVDGGRTFQGRFAATLEGAELGEMTLVRSTFDGRTADATPLTMRSNQRQDRIAVLIRLSGNAVSRHNDRVSHQRPGDITVLDAAKPLHFEIAGHTGSLMVELPRERLESMLGPATLYAGLAIEADMPGAGLVRTFFDQLILVHAQMTPDAAKRMAQIGVELVVASIAERLAQESPRGLQNTVTVQRAKAMIESHFGDPTLDPPQLALMLGISLRHLQQLFHERGEQVADRIWHRRLETAARRLSDRCQAHLPIGTMAYHCGFISPAHFSRRFKDKYGLSPGDFRRSAMVAGS